MKTYGRDKLTIKQMHSTWQAGKKAKHIFYFTGMSCKDGHSSPKYVSNRTCFECNKIRHKERYKKKFPGFLQMQKKKKRSISII